MVAGKPQGVHVQAERKETLTDYCLNVMKPCEFYAPPDVMGALYQCPFCGLITESIYDVNRAHIWNISPRLLAILEKQA